MRKPSTAAVKHWFEYLATSGKLIWKETPGKQPYLKGEEAGCVDKDGYIIIRMQGVNYRAHHLVWIWHGNKLDPTLDIDHINRDRADNRIENLRQVTHKENCNNNGATWVRYRKNRPRRPWYGQVKGKYIGAFFTKEAAVQAVESYITNNGMPDVGKPSGSIQASGGLHPGGNPSTSGDGLQAGVGDDNLGSRDAGEPQPRSHHDC